MKRDYLSHMGRRCWCGGEGKRKCLSLHVCTCAVLGFQEERKNQKKILSSTEPSHDKLVASLRLSLG